MRKEKLHRNIGEALFAGPPLDRLIIAAVAIVRLASIRA
jgi:hypothetical protein